MSSRVMTETRTLEKWRVNHGGGVISGAQHVEDKKSVMERFGVRLLIDSNTLVMLSDAKADKMRSNA
ncbi:hypothetical protein SARC_06667 [Sphaeroforma arctica JP610]|uniref:Uncharacterized protein n=1 Tax=Sphaeroforma arctica JP610 TaxID=667725 RepID=A0A0L0FYE7_9EUKA|nr:hypothetical protein SARC_06667 [Sphaeroforma arctica JP610]KNC80993.1 hypothetical protein SARC_06667 [Sphaeroforma arctica JP610]|eukprot:XP_014154895.1 hypothetical protein SARC_06667 [Sphaeroforma arctica JP610]